MATTADLRLRTDGDVVYVALSDMAALLLDVAATLDDAPQVNPSAALRTLATRLATHPDKENER